MAFKSTKFRTTNVNPYYVMLLQMWVPTLNHQINMIKPSLTRIYCLMYRPRHYIHLFNFFHHLQLMLNKIIVRRNQLRHNHRTNKFYLVITAKLLTILVVSWAYANINDTSSSSSDDAASKNDVMDKATPTVINLSIQFDSQYSTEVEFFKIESVEKWEERV